LQQLAADTLETVRLTGVGGKCTIPKEADSRGIAAARRADRRIGVQEVVGSNPAGPTFANGKPFDQQVEGLSPFWDETYVNENEVQKHYPTIDIPQHRPC
jgi:hypothetical protein